MSFGQALRPHIGVAVGTIVYPVAAMSFGAGIDLAFIIHYGWANCHLLRQGIHTLA